MSEDPELPFFLSNFELGMSIFSANTCAVEILTIAITRHGIIKKEFFMLGCLYCQSVFTPLTYHFENTFSTCHENIWIRMMFLCVYLLECGQYPKRLL